MFLSPYNTIQKLYCPIALICNRFIFETSLLEYSFKVLSIQRRYFYIELIPKIIIKERSNAFILSAIACQSKVLEQRSNFIDDPLLIIFPNWFLLNVRGLFISLKSLLLLNFFHDTFFMIQMKYHCIKNRLLIESCLHVTDYVVTVVKDQHFLEFDVVLEVILVAGEKT